MNRNLRRGPITGQARQHRAATIPVRRALLRRSEVQSSPPDVIGQDDSIDRDEQDDDDKGNDVWATGEF
ncbi:MAG: hypothetical protein ACRDS0_23445 [Pseudonocardiaceae bacterium]